MAVIEKFLGRAGECRRIAGSTHDRETKAAWNRMAVFEQANHVLQMFRKRPVPGSSGQAANEDAIIAGLLGHAQAIAQQGPAA